MFKKIPTIVECIDKVLDLSKAPKVTRETAIRKVSQGVKDVWEGQNKPTLHVNSIIKRLTQIYEDYNDKIIKNLQGRRGRLLTWKAQNSEPFIISPSSEKPPKKVSTYCFFTLRIWSSCIHRILLILYNSTNFLTKFVKGSPSSSTDRRKYCSQRFRDGQGIKLLHLTK